MREPRAWAWPDAWAAPTEGWLGQSQGFTPAGPCVLGCVLESCLSWEVDDLALGFSVACPPAITREQQKVVVRAVPYLPPPAWEEGGVGHIHMG